MLFGEEEGGRERVGALVAGMQREYELSTETSNEEKATVDGFLCLFLSGKG